MHGVDAAGDAARTRQRNGPRPAFVERAEKILDRLTWEQRGVCSDLTGSQMRVTASQHGEPVLAGGHVRWSPRDCH